MFHLCAISPEGAGVLEKKGKETPEDDPTEGQDQLDDALREGAEDEIDEDLAAIED